MPEYYVEWSISVEAATPEDAARFAQAIQRDPDSTATIFKVIEFDSGGDTENIDLSESDEAAKVEEGVP